MGTTNQKSTIDTHTKKKKQSKHNTKDNHQITREESKKKKKGTKKNYKNNLKIINKMAVSIYQI